MKTAVIELYHVSVPLKQTFWPTWIPGYPQTHNRFTLVRVVTDDGIDRGLLRKYGKRFFKINETRLKIKVIREKGIRTALALKKRKEGR